MLLLLPQASAIGLLRAACEISKAKAAVSARREMGAEDAGRARRA